LKTELKFVPHLVFFLRECTNLDAKFVMGTWRGLPVSRNGLSGGPVGLPSPAHSYATKNTLSRNIVSARFMELNTVMDEGTNTVTC
jgi:hypothetical protein